VIIKELEETLQYGERINLECKEAKSDVPKSVWETYSSFANTSGGLILLGVKENTEEKDVSKRFEVIGVQNPNKVIVDFWNTLNGEKVNRNILIDSDVTKVNYNGKSLVCIHVPQANYEQRPVYIKGNPMKGTYKRNHEGDYHCSEDEVKAMFRDASDTGNDGGLLDGYTMDDIDEDSLKAYRIEFDIRNPGHVWSNKDDKEFLRNLGGIAKDRSTEKEWLTTAGLLMFGKGLPIRERFDNIRMDFIDKTNLLPGQRWTDRLTYDGTWENNLYTFLHRVLPKLVSNLKRPFRMEGMSRVDDTPVHKAIREALINLIIHSDYLITGTLKVEKNDDSFLFSNPGSLKLPVQTIYNGGNSKPRNPRIQTMLRMIGYGENAGSGFPTILSAWQEESWRQPDLKDNPELKQVELRLWMVSLMPPECSEYLYRLMGHDYAQLSANEQIILSTAYLEKEVSNSRMRTILGLHPTDVGKLLFGLVQKTMLLSTPNGRWTTYTLNTNYEILPEQMQITEMESPNQEKATLQKEEKTAPKEKDLGKFVNQERARELILEHLKDHMWITNADVRVLCGCNSDQAHYILKCLCKASDIVAEGKGRGMKYCLNAKNEWIAP
jgi:predicted HTH transcriptional regulator